ncbi:MAG: AMP-binding protein, partial [Glaciecola sp.]
MSYANEYSSSIDTPARFWGDKASALPWFVTPTTILSKDENNMDRWFADGVLNTCYMAVDHHVQSGRGDQAAIIYDSPVTNTKSQLTYSQLQTQVAAFAGALRDKGVGKGDRVIIYMPMIPEAAIAMLAVARLGAIHSVVFGGFAPA